MLDIGCGAGGIDVALVRNHAAGFVCGIDVEDRSSPTPVPASTARTCRPGSDWSRSRPDPCPFHPAVLTWFLSKDSIVHIPDKCALMAEIFRVLKPGGLFLASDWLIGTETISPQMAEYIAAEGLDFGMATPARYLEAMAAAGFAEGQDHFPQCLVPDRARGRLAAQGIGRCRSGTDCRTGLRRPEHRHLVAHDPGAGHRRALPDPSGRTPPNVTPRPVRADRVQSGSD